MGMYTGKGRGHLIRKATASERGTVLLGDGDGGGGGGTSNYNDLTNKPKLNGVELKGDIQIDFPSDEFMPKAYKVQVGGGPLINIPINNRLNLFFTPKPYIKDEVEYAGYTINISSATAAETEYHIHVTSNALGLYGGTWVQCKEGVLEFTERISFLDEQPALFESRTAVDIELEDSTSKMMYKITLLGVTNEARTVNHVTATITKTQIDETLV